MATQSRAFRLKYSAPRDVPRNATGHSSKNRFERKLKKEIQKSTVDRLIASMTPEERRLFDEEYTQLLAEEERLKREYEGRTRQARESDNTEQVSAEVLPGSNT
jgi:hypothetical protein